jgi:hypothetical protein
MLLEAIAGHATGEHPLTLLNVKPYEGDIAGHASQAVLVAFGIVCPWHTLVVHETPGDDQILPATIAGHGVHI